MQRMFQQFGLIHADEIPAGRSTVDGLDMDAFSRYFERRYGKPVSSTGLSTEKLLHNLYLARAGTPNLAGMLLQAPGEAIFGR
jgi:ATP-dependent DNA helicase RecG